MVRGREVRPRYRVEGPFVLEGAAECPVFLIVAKGVDRRSKRGDRKRRDPSFFLVTAIRDEVRWDLPFPAEELLGWIWQRWEVEVAHREMKTGFGLGEAQC